MICYRLRCADGHGFEGWFRDSGAFGQQAAAGLISCPQCGATQVEQALMAPAIRSSRKQEAAPPAASAVQVAGEIPDALRALLQRTRAEIERQCDDVGQRFAEEARRIHHGEAEARGIYGHATEAERETLRDEGIEFSSIPWLDRADG